MKRRREDEDMEKIVWQTPANPPERHDYIFRDGVRYVRPYYFEFICHVKNRWAGKTVVDLFADEFKGRNYDYYVSAVKCGRIQVDGEMVPVSYIVQSSQRISHFLHRHEPPVMECKISILHEEPDVLTICKPPSVPVHPCAIHRLDRLVSGLLILARSASKADHFRQQIEAGMVKKEYIARVKGVFPVEEQVVNANVNYNAREGRSTVEVDSAENSGAPLKGKTACTKFTRISTNGTHSIVSCEPISGRTHQIRVHLQHTGHPIANDQLYLSKDFTDRTARGSGADRAAENSTESQPASFDKDSFGAPEQNMKEEDFKIDPMCTHCPDLAPSGYDGHEVGLWLHCVRYSGPGWTYECPHPDWALLE